MADLIHRVLEDLAGRAHGPLHFRLLMQPAVAAVLATRAAVRDARARHPLSLRSLIVRSADRRAHWRRVWQDIGRILMVGLALDAAYQLMVLHAMYPGEAVIVAALVALAPYLAIRVLLSRALIHRMKP